MTVVVTDLGEVQLLNVLVRREDMAGVPWHLHLYRNDYSPHRSSVLADFVEANFALYDIVEMARSLWTYPQNVAGIAVTYWNAVATTWTPGSGSQTVYGIYVTDDLDAVVLWAARFDPPQVVNAISPATVRPFLRLRSIVEPAP